MIFLPFRYYNSIHSKMLSEFAQQKYYSLIFLYCSFHTVHYFTVISHYSYYTQTDLYDVMDFNILSYHE